MPAVQPSDVVATIDKIVPRPDDPQLVLRAEHSAKVITILSLIEKLPEACLSRLAADARLLFTLAIEATKGMVEQWKSVGERERRLTGGPGLGRLPELDHRHPIAVIRSILATLPDDHAASISAQRDAALLDALTALPNRRAYDSDLGVLVASAIASGEPLSLVMVDVDHFKKVNDTHGHTVGDQVLREVAKRLESAARGKGMAYRYGGEELVILLPNHATDEALAVAERARKALSAQPVGTVPVTASFGVATLPDHAADATALYDLADKATYDAKSRGRNLVRYSGEPEPESPGPERRPRRRGPEPDGVTEAQVEKLRTTLLVEGETPRCPKDNARLRVIDMTTMDSVGNDYLVTCPMCGWSANI